MTAQEYITLRASHFATDPNLNGLVTIAELEISEAIYGDRRFQAVALLVCHWLALKMRDSDGSAIPGQITSEKTGGLSRSYGGNNFFGGTVQSTNDEYLSQTSWGVELQSLRKSTIVPIFTRMF